MSNEYYLKEKKKKNEKLNPFDLSDSINHSEQVLGKAKEVGEQVKFASTFKAKLVLMQIISTKMKQYWRRTNSLVRHEPMPSCAEFVLEERCSSLTLKVFRTMGILLQTQN